MMYALKTEIPIDSHCKAIPTPSVKRQASDWMHCVYGDAWEWSGVDLQRQVKRHHRLALVTLPLLDVPLDTRCGYAPRPR